MLVLELFLFALKQDGQFSLPLEKKCALICCFMLVFLMCSFDEKIACQKILNKKGLKGYQVLFEFEPVVSL